jgi:hypothetical protein
MRRQVLDWTLRSASRRLFIAELHIFLNRATMAELDAFAYLKTIVATEISNEVDDDTFGKVVSAVLMWLAVLLAGPDAGPVRPAQQIAIADTLDSILAKTDLTKRPQIAPDTSGVLAVNATLAAVSDALKLLSIEKVAAVFNNSLILLESGSRTMRMTAGIMFGQMAAHIADYRSPQMMQLTGQLLSLVPGAFDSRSAVHQLGIAASLGAARMFEIPENDLPRVCAAAIQALQYEKADTECRRNAFEFLAGIIDRVPPSEIEPDPLFEALRYVFETIPSSMILISVLGLFSVIGVNPDRVLDVIEKIAGGPIVEGLARLLGPVELATAGLRGMRSAKGPYSPRFLKLLCGIALTVDPVNDRCVNEFKQVLLPVLIDAVNPHVPDLYDLALGTIQFLIK